MGQIMAMSMMINSEDPLAKFESVTEAPWNQMRLTTNLNRNLNSGLFELVSFVETFKPTSGQTFTDGFRLNSLVISLKLLAPIRKTLIDDANRRLLANPLTAKQPMLSVDDALLTKMRVQISSNIIRQMNVTTLTATLNTVFNSSITVTLSEDIKALISTSSSPYSTTAISQHGEETITETGSIIRMINKTFTSKTISCANWKVSNMFPVSIVNSFVSPIATDISISATDPLVSFPGATLAPWNGTLFNAIGSFHAKSTD
jgi:hypothetical protein